MFLKWLFNWLFSSHIFILLEFVRGIEKFIDDLSKNWKKCLRNCVWRVNNWKMIPMDLSFRCVHTKSEGGSASFFLVFETFFFFGSAYSRAGNCKARMHWFFSILVFFYSGIQCEKRYTVVQINQFGCCCRCRYEHRHHSFYISFMNKRFLCFCLAWRVESVRWWMVNAGIGIEYSFNSSFKPFDGSHIFRFSLAFVVIGVLFIER